MSLRDEAARIRSQADENRLRDQAAVALARQKDAEGRLKQREDEYRRLEREFDFLTRLGVNQPPKKKWNVRGSAKGHHGTPVLMLSDLHLDERIDPAQVQGMNAYSREIAKMRLAKVFESAVKITRDYWTGLQWDGVIVLLGGDLFTGLIHEELVIHAEDSVLGSMIYWHDEVAKGLALLADTFGKVHVASVVGNHGRLSRKPLAKGRVRDSLDWAFSMGLARSFKDDPRFTFHIPESADCEVEVYGRTMLLTHGDQTRGGGGIGGIWPPIMRMNARKAARANAVGRNFELLCMGHWHQITFAPWGVISGSLCGFDEYAYVSNFSYEPPAQPLWVMTPEHGRTWMTPIYPMDRKAEGW